MLFFYKIKNESFKLLYIFIPLLISGFLIVNASKNNGGVIKGPNVDQDLLEELAYQNLGFAYTQDLFIPIE